MDLVLTRSANYDLVGWLVGWLAGCRNMLRIAGDCYHVMSRILWDDMNHEEGTSSVFPHDLFRMHGNSPCDFEIGMRAVSHR